MTASGKSREAERTVRVGLRREGFLDYLWFTDFEHIDPNLRAESDPTCYLYGWEFRSSGNWGPNPG